MGHGRKALGINSPLASLVLVLIVLSCLAANSPVLGASQTIRAANSAQAHGATAAVSSGGSDPVSVNDLAFQIQGYNSTEQVSANGRTVNLTSFDYPEWDAFLQSLNYSNTKGTLYNGPPENFRVLYYQDIQTGETIQVEIYGYGSTTAATNEFNKQYGPFICGTWCMFPQYSSGSRACCKEGPIFQRFAGPQALLRRGQFMVFIAVNPGTPPDNALASSILADFTQKFVDSLFTAVPEGTQPPPPPTVNFTGKVVWGVKPGDTLSWLVKSTAFSGNVEEGGGESKNTYNITMEVVRIGNDNLSILIRSPISQVPDFEYAPQGCAPGYYQCEQITQTGYPGSKVLVNLTLPAYNYFWENATSVIQGDNSPYPLIFPIYRNGNLTSVINSEVSGLQLSEGSEYVTGSYSTPASPGNSPAVSYDKQITVHRGSGITTSGSFYYENNDLSETRSTSLSLVSTNFNLSSRLPLTIQPVSISTPTSPSPTTSTSTSLSTTSISTSTCCGKIPEFPAQLGITLMVIVVVVASYVLARRGLGIDKQAPV